MLSSVDSFDAPMTTADPIYPNAPLVEAVFEIRFPGEPSIECRRDQFFERVRSEYPTVLVPKVQAGQAPALGPYHFKRPDGQASVMTAINRFAFSTKKYEGFRLFKTEALRLIRIFSEMFSIGKLNRTGLRYINVIPFVREQDRFPLSDYLNLSVKLPRSFPEQSKYLNISFVSPTDAGSVTTRIEPLLAEDQSHEAILLDFDYAMETDLHIRDIERYIDQSHRHTKEMFEEVITDHYRKYLQGETV